MFLFKFEREIRKFRSVFRNAGFLVDSCEPRTLKSIDGVELHHDLVNFFFQSLKVNVRNWLNHLLIKARSKLTRISSLGIRGPKKNLLNPTFNRIQTVQKAQATVETDIDLDIDFSNSTQNHLNDTDL